MSRSRARFFRHLIGLLFVLTGSVGLGAAGCAAIEDPGCSSDAECRFGRTCVEGVCAGEPDTTSDPTNNGTTNNGTTNNGTTNNGTTNSGNSFVETACDTDEDCPTGSSCERETCTRPCLDSDDCPGDLVCGGPDGCITPRMCSLIQDGESDGTCAAAWVCDDVGEAFIVCEPASGAASCQCIDAATGEFRSFDVDNLNCEREDLTELVNQRCQFGIPGG